MKFKNKVLLSVLTLSIITSCSAISYMFSDKDLKIKTVTSSTVWLEPVSPEKRIVFLEVKNSSDNADFNDIKTYIGAAMSSNGYTITQDPEKANYMLQANVKTAVLTEENPQAIKSGLDGAAVGALTTSAFNGSNKSVAQGALLVGLANIAFDAMYTNKYYLVLTDIRIRERSNNKITTNSKLYLSQGDSGYEKQNFSSETNWKNYTNKIAVVTNQINMDLDDATRKVKEALTQSISGMF